jgi:iron transport multicopper oxidase
LFPPVVLLQYLDGLLGAFIVQSPTDPYKSLYDDEIVIVLQDFYHVDGIAMATPRPDNHHWLPFPIINGKGTFECNSTLEYARWCTPTERTEFKIKSGLRYRLRIIAATARVGLRLAISDHSLTVINRQGTDMNRFDTNEIYMSIADRYDVILNANKPIGEYLMRIKITGCDACNENGSVNVQPNLGYESWASFRYEGAAKGTAKDFTLFSENTLVPVSYLDERIVPLIAVHPPPATKTWTLTMTSERFFYDNDVAPHRKWFFNGKVFHHGAVPLLYEVIQGKRFSAEDVRYSFLYEMSY